jgi:hypothetical protein
VSGHVSATHAKNWWRPSSGRPVAHKLTCIFCPSRRMCIRRQAGNYRHTSALISEVLPCIRWCNFRISQTDRELAPSSAALQLTICDSNELAWPWTFVFNERIGSSEVTQLIMRFVGHDGQRIVFKFQSTCIARMPIPSVQLMHVDGVCPSGPVVRTNKTISNSKKNFKFKNLTSNLQNLWSWI